MKNLIKKFVLILSLLFGAHLIFYEKKKLQHKVFQNFAKISVDKSSNFVSHSLNGENFFKKYNLNSSSQFLTITIFVIIIFASFLLLQYKFFANYLHTSLIKQEDLTFTGTVSPIQKVPNWVALTDAERSYTYDQLSPAKLIDIPEYNLNTISQGTVWSKTNGVARNAWITYSVTYMGNYRLDGKENQGSHLGVDIKAPIGTPVVSIADGIIYDTGFQSGGFGNFIVVAHSVPESTTSTKKKIIFSNYAHLSEISVKKNQKVTKGQLIGKVGETGMATAPHLHFQVDNENAPYHPYWPFSWKDVEANGLNSYFDAVNAGLGKDKALKYTQHPITIVKNFANFSDNLQVATAGTLDSDKNTVEQKDENETNEKVAEIKEKEPLKTSAPKTEEKLHIDVNEKNTTTTNALSVVFKADRYFVPNEEKTFYVVVNDVSKISDKGIKISSTLKNNARITPTTIFRENFENNEAAFQVKTSSSSNFKLVAEGDFGTEKSLTLLARPFSDVEPNNRYAESISYLKEKKVIDGYSDGSFRPQGVLNRAESAKLIVEINNLKFLPTQLKFTDVPEIAWFAKYVNTAQVYGITKGYPDNTFRPGNSVTRAEFLALAIRATQQEIPTNQPIAYEDIKPEAWYKDYFAFSKKYGLLLAKKGGAIQPDNAITREDAAYVLWKLNQVLVVSS